MATRTTRRTRTTRSTNAQGTITYPQNPLAGLRLPPPPEAIPIPYAHPARRATQLVDQQIHAALNALPTTQMVASPYLHQQDVITQLTQSLMQHLTNAAAYRRDLGGAVTAQQQQQGQAAAQSIGGASPEAAQAAGGDAQVLGGYGSNAADAVAAELGAAPGMAANYQSRVAQTMQQALDREINQPRQQVLSQRPSILQTILDRLLTANTQIRAQNQNAETQASDIALRAAQLGLSGYTAATSRGQGDFQLTHPAQTATTSTSANPTADANAARSAADRFNRMIDNRTDALFAQHSRSTTSQKPGYYVYYQYHTLQPPSSGVGAPRDVIHNGRIYVDQNHGEYLRKHAGTGVDLASYLGLPKGSVRVGNLEPVGAGSNVTTYTGQGYYDALTNLERYATQLSAQYGLGYTQDQIHQFALNAVNSRWVPGTRGRPGHQTPAPQGNRGSGRTPAGAPAGYPGGHTYP